jgi:hypothetical protein
MRMVIINRRADLYATLAGSNSWFISDVHEILIGRSAFVKQLTNKLARTSPTIAEAATITIAAIRK